MMMFKGLFLCALFFSSFGFSAEKPFVIGQLYCQLGNNMFQVATAHALAWDNNAEAYFPELRPENSQKHRNMDLNIAHVFFRCLIDPPRAIATEWKEPSFAYHPIPFQPDMRIDGFFQSEKYFAHHRARLLELFAPSPEDLAYLRSKYQAIIDHPCTVGVQIRYYYDDPEGSVHIQFGKDYLSKALLLVPEDALFVVSSNDLDFARRNLPSSLKNVVFIEDEPHYINLFLLSLCKHNIITNSSFGWWAAWLNQNSDKIVITPSLWVHPRLTNLPTQDLWPEGWIKVEAKWGASKDSSNY